MQLRSTDQKLNWLKVGSRVKSTDHKLYAQIKKNRDQKLDVM